MSQELITQAQAMFDTPEKWNAYIELKAQTDLIIKQWFQKMLSKANRYFLQNSVEGWAFHSWEPWDIRWYLTEYGNDSIMLWYRGGVDFVLCFNPNLYEKKIIYDMLKDPKYTQVMDAMELTTWIMDDNYIAWE